jgi:hypothetical protein
MVALLDAADRPAADLLAAADPLASPDLFAAAGLVAAADGAGFPDDVLELDARAAAGTAITVAAVTAAMARRRLRTDMMRSFVDRMLPVQRPHPKSTIRRP